MGRPALGVVNRLRAALQAQRGALGTALGNPALRASFLALAASIAVDTAQLVAISVYLFAQHGAASVVALGVVRAMAPALCVPALTSLSVRMGHGRLLGVLTVGGALATAASTAAMLAVLPSGFVIGAAGVTSVCVSAFRPITAAVRPLLVRTPEELVACSAVAGFVDGVGTLVGPMLIGVALAVAGPATATGVSVLLLAGAAIGCRWIPRIPRGDRPASNRAGRAPGPPRRPEVWVVIALVSVQTMVRGALNTVIVAYVIGSLGLVDGVVGLLLAAIGFGSMVGLPVALGAVGRRRVYRALGAGLVLWGLPLALAAPLPDLPAVAVLFTVAGIGNALVDVAHATALPRIVAPDRLGWVLGILEGTVQVCMAAGAAVGGLLLAVMDPRAVMYVIGGALVLVAALFARTLFRFDGRLVHHDEEVEMLRAQRMFSALPLATLDALAQRMGRAEFVPGEVIMAEGASGEDYLIVTGGTVLICKDDHVINILHRGAAFGEIALIRNVPRTASAVAATAVSVRMIDRDSFLAALGHDPLARSVAESVVSGRLASTPRYR